MKLTKISRVTSFFLGLVCLMALLTPISVQAAASIPAVKGPIPVTADSYPFGAANRTIAPQDLSQFGYVEEEYLVSGSANVYDFDANGNVVVKTANAPYTTRILIRRPASPQKFSGTVIVELLNPTALYDTDYQWQYAGVYFMEHGDAWVGITSKPVTAKTLKTFDPRRYAAVSWANPLPPDKTCPKPVSTRPDDSTPATENGLIWDIASQVGALLKSEAKHNPLKGFSIKMAFLTGYSQTGGYVVTYVNFIRPLPGALGPNGKPVYDGYLIGDGDGLPIPLNQCTAPIMPGDPRFVIQPRPEPVISVASQVLVTGMGAYRPDSNSAKDRYRHYEIAGASHVNMRAFSLLLKPEDMIKAGFTAVPDCTEFATYGMTDFPFEYFMRGAFANLDAWARSNIAPPKGSRIEVEPIPEGTKPTFPPFMPVKVDKYGNALGGVRSPYVDVPTGTYYTRSTPTDPKFFDSVLFCSIVGYKVPFKKDLLMKLYPTHKKYVKKVNKQVKKMVKARLITASDGQRIKEEAAKATWK